MRAEQPDVLQQEIAEIDRIESLQALLVGGIELEALAVGERGAFAGLDLVRREAAVLPAVDHAGENAGRPALLVDVLGLEELLEQPDLVVDVEDGEIGLEAGELGMAAQDLDPDRVEGAEPRHALHRLADHLADPQFHLPRRLVGESHGEDFRRPGAAEAQDMGDPRGEHAGLAGSRTRQHQHRPIQRHHRLALLGIEPFEIGRAGRCAGTGRNPARGGRPQRISRVFERVSQSRPFPDSRRGDSPDEKMAPAGAICEGAWGTGAHRPRRTIRPGTASGSPRSGRSLRKEHENCSSPAAYVRAAMPMRRPAASGTGRRAWDAFISASRAATCDGKAAVFLACMST